MIDYIKLAKKKYWSPSKSYWLTNVNGMEEVVSYICYAAMPIKNGVLSTVLHPFPDHMDISYVNWVLNSDMFGDIFVTKDAEEGMRYGFKYIPKGTKEDTLFKLLALRFFHEFRRAETYTKLESEGFTPKESFWLLHHLTYSKQQNKFSLFNGNSNHYVIPRDLPFDLFSTEHVKKGHDVVTVPYYDAMDGDFSRCRFHIKKSAKTEIEKLITVSEEQTIENFKTYLRGT